MKKITKEKYNKIKRDVELFNQSELAFLYGVSQPTVSRIKRSTSYTEYANDERAYIPFLAETPCQDKLIPYYSRGKFVADLPKEVVEEISNDVLSLFSEVETWKKRVYAVTTAWAVLALGTLLLILAII